MKVFHHAGNISKVQVPKMRAMTITGLCRFLGITETSWVRYKYDRGESFRTICEKVTNIVREQKFTGAAADLLNPGFIARDLGLADKRELAGEGGGPIRTESRVDYSQLDTEELRKLDAIAEKIRTNTGETDE